MSTSKIKLPNFFILGAPKCGTSSLAQWLSEHHQIYISPVKEPHFFNTDMKNIKTLSEAHYTQLFKGVKNTHKAIGEASVCYLYSHEAVPNIEQKIPSPKYIVMLRNPIEMAPSLHQQMLSVCHEHIKDFEEAWKLSEYRADYKYNSILCKEPNLLNYKDFCLLGKQVKRLLENVHRDRILFIFLEDVKKNPRKEYLRVLSFLEVDKDNRMEFPVINSAKKLRSRSLAIFINYLFLLRRQLGLVQVLKLNNNLMKSIQLNNLSKQPREHLYPELQQELIKYFSEDIQLLQKLTGQDLSDWLKSK